MFGEAHAHMVLDCVDHKVAIAKHKDKPNEAIIRQELKAYQDHGVDFIREGGDKWGVCQLAKKIAPEYGIDFRMPAYPIAMKNCYGNFIGNGFETISEYIALVKRAIKEDADYIKIMISGICDFNEFGVMMMNSVPEDIIKEEIRIAHEEGLAVMAHSNTDGPTRAALEAGADSIEHGNYLSEDTIRMLAKSNTVWVPTLSTFGNLIGTGDHPDEAVTKLWEYQKKNVRLAYELGASIAVGSDAGAPRVYHGTGVYTEYGWLKKALSDHDDLDERLLKADQKIRDTFKRK